MLQRPHLIHIRCVSVAELILLAVSEVVHVDTARHEDEVESLDVLQVWVQAVLGHLSMEVLPLRQLLFHNASTHTWTPTAQSYDVTLQDWLLHDTLHVVWAGCPLYLWVLQFNRCIWSSLRRPRLLVHVLICSSLLTRRWSHWFLCLRLGQSAFCHSTWLRRGHYVAQREGRFITLGLLFLKLLQLFLRHFCLRNFSVRVVRRAPRLLWITITLIAFWHIFERHSLAKADLFCLISVLWTRIDWRAHFRKFCAGRLVNRTFCREIVSNRILISLRRVELLQLYLSYLPTLVHALKQTLMFIWTWSYSSCSCTNLRGLILDFKVVGLNEVHLVFITWVYLRYVNCCGQLTPCLPNIRRCDIASLILKRAGRLLLILRNLLRGLKSLRPFVWYFVLLVRKLLIVCLLRALVHHF